MMPRTTNFPATATVRTELRAAGVAAALCAALAALAGGCGGGTLVSIEDAADFQRRVIESDRPVLVEFYKTACPTCVWQEDWLAELAPEYAGDVLFAKFLIKDLSWSSTAPTIQERYDLFWVPTMILFVNGEEKHRWELNYFVTSEFRAVLDEAAGVATAAAEPPPTPWTDATQPVTQWPDGTPAKCEEGLGCPIDREH